MKRVYYKILQDHFLENRQMAFVSGPRQVGKTTIAKNIADYYLSWDNKDDRILILRGHQNIGEKFAIPELSKKRLIIVFDELHKYSKWKTFIKGYFDTYGENIGCLITGSARLNIYKKGGDSLMGRYFPYRIHPFSVKEIITDKYSYKNEFSQPIRINNDIFEQLLRFGGFPEPLIKSNTRFYNRWNRTRSEQFLHEDIRDLTNIHEIYQLEVFAELLKSNSGQLLNYSNLANDINVSVDTIKRWLSVFNSFYYAFTIQPWFINVRSSLLKQPKAYLWDWSLCNDIGSRNENFIASHLLKAIHFWSDIGLGDYKLHFIRDKMKREVDFLVTKNNKPWFLVEVKTSKQSISKNLIYFHNQLKTEYAFQVTIDIDYVDRSCFDIKTPIIVPASTFLSQLI